MVERWSNREITLPALIIRPQTHGGACEILSLYRQPRGHGNTHTHTHTHTQTHTHLCCIHGSEGDQKDALIHGSR